MSLSLSMAQTRVIARCDWPFGALGGMTDNEFSDVSVSLFPMNR